MEQTSYRKDSKSPPVVAMAKALGLVEGGYTPKAAKIACLLTALVVREDVEKIVDEFGGMTMGSATLYRVPQVVMAGYEVRRAEFEQPLRERSTIPPEAATVQFGLDGVMVPQEGEHCDPRGRSPKGDPEPPRHECVVGTMPASPRDEDGTMGVAWHEVSVGTVAYFDKDGTHLDTTYFGRMPEPYKATLEERLTAFVGAVTRPRCPGSTNHRRIGESAANDAQPRHLTATSITTGAKLPTDHPGRVAELADAADLGSAVATRRGSSPLPSTREAVAVT